MKILLISPLPPPMGGMANWTLRYISYAEKLKWQIDTVNSSTIGSRAKNINSKRNLWNEIDRTLRIIVTLKRKLKVKSDPYDVVHINSPCTKLGIIRDGFLIWICKVAGVPVVFECHSNIEHMLGGSVLSRTALRSALKKASLTIVLNDLSLKYAVSCAPARKDHVVVLPNFIEDEFVANCHDIRNQVKQALFVGHVTEEKGIYELFETARCESNIHFELLGKIDTKIDLSKKPVNVSLIGEVSSENVMAAMDNADVLFFPTHAEGFSLVLLESMARGLPIIATNVGANADMIENKGGVIVPTLSIKDFTNAIDYIQTSEVRREMSTWNISKVRSAYTCDAVFTKLNYLYTKCSVCGDKIYDD